ncbi:ABC transporter permease [Roseomonas harenae]|uniref:ABC transporter permease n=1 Tax=Muricoccus harenae TaxID=2692566 RepID=UPI001331930C|nr:ABC transporter permease [Roseomonas harenae]
MAIVLIGLFSLFGALPGDAVDVLALQGDLDAGQMAHLRTEMGLDLGLVPRFAHWSAAAVSGDFGVSQRFGQPVSGMLMEAVSTTLQLAALSGGIGVVLAFGLILGVALQSRGAKIAVGILNIWSIAVPTFCVGVAALLLFSVHLGWLPAVGSLVAPVVILTLDNAGQVAKPLAEEVAEVAVRQHVIAARARGLPPLWIAWWHILPLAAPVGVALSGIMVAGLLAGTLTMEILFGLPGVGALVLQGIQGRDEPVVLAGLALIALAVIGINALVGVIQLVLDPRAAR